MINTDYNIMTRESEIDNWMCTKTKLKLKPVQHPMNPRVIEMVSPQQRCTTPPKVLFVYHGPLGRELGDRVSRFWKVLRSLYV